MSQRSRRFWLWAQVGALPLFVITIAVFLWVGNKSSPFVLPIVITASALPVAYLFWVWSSYHKSRVREIGQALREHGFRVDIEPAEQVRERFAADLFRGEGVPPPMALACVENCTWLAEGRYAGTRIAMLEGWRDIRIGDDYAKSWHLFIWAPDLGPPTDPDAVPRDPIKMHGRKITWLPLSERIGLEVSDGVLRPHQFASVLDHFQAEATHLTAIAT